MSVAQQAVAFGVVQDHVLGIIRVDEAIPAQVEGFQRFSLASTRRAGSDNNSAPGRHDVLLPRHEGLRQPNHGGVVKVGQQNIRSPLQFIPRGVQLSQCRVNGTPFSGQQPP
ncbi:hypothetical protein [Paenarthrobacter sp. AB444]|uniref:hypothetical protein n=1 Tax=Paenarthrobacter sp. AB444 TaxID=3025681 RepID=UPI0023667AF7|nr:hypothetical protein [Paenarthrobacter sp. AB444]MDD7835851.1 hypothetical protein [Paenarthrobacter sp. AB444]